MKYKIMQKDNKGITKEIEYVEGKQEAINSLHDNKMSYMYQAGVLGDKSCSNMSLWAEDENGKIIGLTFVKE
jgi:hypothetical protein